MITAQEAYESSMERAKIKEKELLEYHKELFEKAINEAKEDGKFITDYYRMYMGIELEEEFLKNGYQIKHEENGYGTKFYAISWENPRKVKR